MNYTKQGGDSEPVRPLRANKKQDMNTNLDEGTDGFGEARYHLARK